MTGTSPSDCLVSYRGNSLGGLTPQQIQSGYSTGQASIIIIIILIIIIIIIIIIFQLTNKRNLAREIVDFGQER